MNRKDIATIICNQLENNFETLQVQYQTLNTNIKYFYMDDLLPLLFVKKIATIFPNQEEMILKKSLKEYKYITAQMDNHDAILEEILFAFQDDRVVRLIQKICGIEHHIESDPNLYAGGLSLMKKDQFLNPHLDNSHDAERKRWRALNLLFYVTPNWELKNGGNLELWPNGVQGKSIEILSKFNRLVVMETHDASWHSVNKVMANQERKCVSNYYFSSVPLPKHNEFHITYFTGRPQEKFKKIWLKFDGQLRMAIRKIFKKGIVKNPHIYKK